ncbi:hypothetical protein PLICBS_003809 [Purpureocillium lilacinum]|uniref:uncharacterized protein n=1 Tax=Purpureocillium lilacinum TaxID=33203 RepID=UPI00207E7618|nr:hypothetical protein PLICBS_003809 [Purpureocillium lilacinum]
MSEELETQFGAAIAAGKIHGAVICATDAVGRVEQVFNYPLGFQPGAGWQYGPGLDWAGRIVERITDSTLDDYVHEHILRPLGIIKAQLYPVTRDDLRDHLVDLNPQIPNAWARLCWVVMAH